MRKNIIRCYTRGLVVALLAALAFTFAGCANPTALNTATYQEVVEGVLWEVTYNTETNEVISIKTPLAIIELDTQSQFFNFMAEYTSNPNAEVVHSSTLSGKPVGENIYNIKKTETYKITCSRADYEVIKETFPTCIYSETPFSYEVIDHNTGETSTVTSIATEVTFASYESTYEQTIIFTVPAA